MTRASTLPSRTCGSFEAAFCAAAVAFTNGPSFTWSRPRTAPLASTPTSALATAAPASSTR